MSPQPLVVISERRLHVYGDWRSNGWTSGRHYQRVMTSVFKAKLGDTVVFEAEE